MVPVWVPVMSSTIASATSSAVAMRPAGFPRASSSRASLRFFPSWQRCCASVRPHHLRFGVTRAHGVGRDALRGVTRRRRARGEADDAVFARAVGGDIRRALEAGDARDVDDAAPARRDHVRRRLPRAEERTRQVRRRGFAPTWRGPCASAARIRRCRSCSRGSRSARWPRGTLERGAHCASSVTSARREERGLPLARAADDADRAPLRASSVRGRAPDAASAAGHERVLSGDAHCAMLAARAR